MSASHFILASPPNTVPSNGVTYSSLALSTTSKQTLFLDITLHNAVNRGHFMSMRDSMSFSQLLQPNED